MTLDEAVREIRANAGRWYVYVIWDGATPFYVGVSQARGGRRERLQDHRWHRSSRCREILIAGRDVGYTIDSWHDTKASVLDREESLIVDLGRLDDGSGPLINGNFGGFGHVRAHTPESRAKMSAALKKSYENPERLARARSHLAVARIKGQSNEAREKRAVASRRRWSREGEHDTQRAALRAAWQRPEKRAHWSEMSRRAMQRPGVKAKVLAVLSASNSRRPALTAPFRAASRQLAAANGWDLKNLPHPSSSVNVWRACAAYFGAP